MKTSSFYVYFYADFYDFYDGFYVGIYFNNYFYADQLNWSDQPSP